MFDWKIRMLQIQQLAIKCEVVCNTVLSPQSQWKRLIYIPDPTTIKLLLSRFKNRPNFRQHTFTFFLCSWAPSNPTVQTIPRMCFHQFSRIVEGVWSGPDKAGEQCWCVGVSLLVSDTITVASSGRHLWWAHKQLSCAGSTTVHYLAMPR